MNQFDKLYKQILNECNNKDIIDQWSFKQGWNNVKNVFKKKKPEERSIMCKKLWKEHNYQQLAKQIKKYKKEKQFNKDPEAQFYYGMLLVKNLINENKLNLHTKNLLLESVTTDKEEENTVQAMSKQEWKDIYAKASSNNGDDLYNIAVCLYVGIPDVVEKNIKLAIEYFTKAAKVGCPEALYNLGVIYQNGQEYGEKGYPHQNEKYALKCYKQATKLGYKEAEEPYNSLLNKLYKGNKEQADQKRELNLEAEPITTKPEQKKEEKEADYNYDIRHIQNTKNEQKLTKGVRYIQRAAAKGCKEAENVLKTDLSQVAELTSISKQLAKHTLEGMESFYSV